MSITNKLMKWLCLYETENGDRPEAIPLTVEEVLDLSEDVQCGYQVFPGLSNPKQAMKFMGVDTWNTPFAEGARLKMLEVPVNRVYECGECDDMEFYTNREFMVKTLAMRLSKRILSNVTHLDLEFSFTPTEAGEKRLMSVRWIPGWIKRVICRGMRKAIPPFTIKRRVRVDVLYPKIRVQLPHNTHTIHARWEEKV